MVEEGRKEGRVQTETQRGRRRADDFARHAHEWHLPHGNRPLFPPPPFPAHRLFPMATNFVIPPYLGGLMMDNEMNRLNWGPRLPPPPDLACMSLALSSLLQMQVFQHTYRQALLEGQHGGGKQPETGLEWTARDRPLPPPLSADATALISNIQHRGRAHPDNSQNTVHTGKITLAELMGEGKTKSAGSSITPLPFFQPPVQVSFPGGKPRVPSAQWPQMPNISSGVMTQPNIGDRTRNNAFAGQQSQRRVAAGSEKRHGRFQQSLWGGQRGTRRQYCLPYMLPEAVERGLINHTLIKGVLRVNIRNYEESYVDNPLGDSEQDILILGMHNRNRALHGDEVVVRVKDRNQWIVRDNLYTAWLHGHLDVSRDDDGKPLTIPPIKQRHSSNRSDSEKNQMARNKQKGEKGDKSENINEPLHYDRESLLRIFSKIKNGDKMDDLFSTNRDARDLINQLAINREDEMGADSKEDEGPLGASHHQLQHTSGAARRAHYRVLADMPDEDWGIPDLCLQKTAEVVYIWTKKNCRAAVGQLKVMADCNQKHALFSPHDSRMPRMLIPAQELPKDFFDRPQDFSKVIFAARLIEWEASAQFATGKLFKSLGASGEIAAETEGLLLANGVDTREFSHAALSSLPIDILEQTWKIPETESKYRRDYRSETVFTVDPESARDLDDALHIRPLSDGLWEVGVHIADVSYFLHSGSELDNWASQRATSVYLVHKVVPMLPRELCEILCSLNPGVDRLTFSVVWQMDDEGQVKDQWFGRSIINSCCKLAYEHAQGFIEEPDREWQSNEVPTMSNGKSARQVSEKVCQLNRLAVEMRKRRFESGALRLDQPRLRFTLNEGSGLPDGCSIYQRKESNSLIEEFMLLANMSVATHIEQKYPDTALLRRHPPPNRKLFNDVLELCELIGYPVQGGSSGGVQKSLSEYRGDCSQKQQQEEEEEKRVAVGAILTEMLIRPMKLAVYFCAGSLEERGDYAHYALNVPLYTHFTSPIRRYPDVMVHRLLAASLGYCPAPKQTVEEIEKQANHCNDKKLAAKQVSDASVEMFFGAFVKECGPLTNERGAVMAVLDHAIDLLLIRYGIIARVYSNRLKLARDPKYEEGPPPSLTLYWDPQVAAENSENGHSVGEKDAKGANKEQKKGPSPPMTGTNLAIKQTLTIGSLVTCHVSALTDPNKFLTVIKPCPDEKMDKL